MLRCKELNSFTSHRRSMPLNAICAAFPKSRSSILYSRLVGEFRNRRELALALTRRAETLVRMKGHPTVGTLALGGVFVGKFLRDLTEAPSLKYLPDTE